MNNKEQTIKIVSQSICHFLNRNCYPKELELFKFVAYTVAEYNLNNTDADHPFLDEPKISSHIRDSIEEFLHKGLPTKYDKSEIKTMFEMAQEHFDILSTTL